MQLRLLQETRQNPLWPPPKQSSVTIPNSVAPHTGRDMNGFALSAIETTRKDNADNDATTPPFSEFAKEKEGAMSKELPLFSLS